MRCICACCMFFLLIPMCFAEPIEEQDQPPRLKFFEHPKLPNIHATVANLSTDHSTYVLGGQDRVKGNDAAAWKNREVPGRLQLWKTDTREKIRDFEGDFGAVYDAAVSGSTVVTVGMKLNDPHNEVLVWDVGSRKSQRILDSIAEPTSVAMRDSTLIVGSDDGQLVVYDLERHKIVRSISSKGMQYRVRFQPNGPHVGRSVWASASFVHQFNGFEEVDLGQTAAGKRMSAAIEFSPRGDLLAVACSEDKEHFVELIDTATWEAVRKLEVREFVSQISFNKTGTLLGTTGNDMHVRVFNPNSGELLGVWKRHAARSDEAILMLGGANFMTTIRGGISFGRLSMPELEEKTIEFLDSRGVRTWLGLLEGEVRALRVDLSEADLDDSIAEKVLLLRKLQSIELGKNAKTDKDPKQVLLELVKARKARLNER